tara:strand:- start:6985 stop:7956 length:972 start_codon:yes stop_codon:yes gene_type:complete
VKICIGSNIVDGPWGGGNLFLKNLKNYLIENNIEVVFNLDDKDIDLILFTDPRTTLGSTSSVKKRQIKNYLKKNKNTVVVQRINECDERKNTRGVNRKYIKASLIADHIVFVSNWLMNLYISQGINISKSSVILSGSNSKNFNTNDKKNWNKSEKIKLITHHWSDNWMKGFKIYQEIDNLLSDTNLSEKLEFTYLGNYPKDLNLNQTLTIPPADEETTAEILKNNHIYITASINEPSGNHHIEAAQCGLPILYLESGGITEYCEGYGLSFTEDNLEEKIYELIEKYDYFIELLKKYPQSSEKMCSDYLNLFRNLINSKKNESL